MLLQKKGICQSYASSLELQMPVAVLWRLVEVVVVPVYQALKPFFAG
jgi:hypothetical protein